VNGIDIEEFEPAANAALAAIRETAKMICMEY
jgi:hypothetical protein